MFGFDVINEVLDFVPHFVCDLAVAAEKGDFDVVVSCRMALFGNIGFAEEIVDSHVEIVRELFQSGIISFTVAELSLIHILYGGHRGLPGACVPPAYFGARDAYVYPVDRHAAQGHREQVPCLVKKRRRYRNNRRGASLGECPEGERQHRWKADAERGMAFFTLPHA